MKISVVVTMALCLSSRRHATGTELDWKHRLRRVNNPGRHHSSSEPELDLHQGESRELQDVPFVTLPEGIWTSHGYGYVFSTEGFDNDPGNFSWMEETQLSCIVMMEGINLEFMAAEMGMASALSENDTVLTLKEGITEYHGDRSDTYVGACAAGITPGPDDEGYVRDPVFTMAVMKQWLYEQYAFFDLHYSGGYDAWAQMTNSFSVAPNATDEELLSSMKRLISFFEDVAILAEDECACKELSWYAEVYMEYKNLQEKNMSAWKDEVQYLEAQYLTWQDILDNVYLDSLKGSFGNTTLYGKVMKKSGGACAAGYMAFTDFDPTDGGELWGPTLIEAMTDLHDCPALIIDVRINIGGSDVFALTVPSYLTSEPYQAFSKRAFVRNTTDGTSSFTQAQDIVVEPELNADLRYQGPVIVLASESTIGSGEVLVLSLLPLPNITIMGQPTYGTIAGSSIVPDLPNGWLVALSNEEYSSAVDGEIYQGVGIPPDVTLTPHSPLSFEDRQNQKDTWLEAAIQFAANLTSGK